MDDLEDLIGFLADKRPEVVLVALDIIKGLTGTPEGIHKLKSKLEKLLVHMLRLVPVPDPTPEAIQVSECALTSLVNLSQDRVVGAKLLTMKTIGRVMDYLREGSCQHYRLMAMLLCNLTVSEAGCKDLLQLGQDKLEGLNVAVLLKRFVVSGVDWVEGRPDPFEHLAGVVVNATRLPQGRKLLLQPGRGLLQALVSQLQSPSEMRRRGSAGAIKNCCMQAEEDGNLESLLADEFVLMRMLKPIDGEEPKEKDVAVRQAMAESLLALASSKEGRDALWKVKGQDILKKGYEYEEDPGVCIAMEHAAELFIFNRSVEQVDEEPSSDAVPGETAAEGEAAAAEAPKAPSNGGGGGWAQTS